MSDVLLTLPQLAARWNCSTKTATRRVRALRLPITYVTRRPQIAVSAIERAERRSTYTRPFATSAIPGGDTRRADPVTSSHQRTEQPAHLGDPRADVPQHSTHQETTARRAGAARGASLLPTGRREVPAEKDPTTTDGTRPARRPGANSTGGAHA